MKNNQYTNNANLSSLVLEPLDHKPKKNQRNYEMESGFQLINQSHQVSGQNSYEMLPQMKLNKEKFLHDDSENHLFTVKNKKKLKPLNNESVIVKQQVQNDSSPFRKKDLKLDNLNSSRVPHQNPPSLQMRNVSYHQQPEQFQEENHKEEQVKIGNIKIGVKNKLSLDSLPMINMSRSPNHYPGQSSYERKSMADEIEENEDQVQKWKNKKKTSKIMKQQLPIQSGGHSIQGLPQAIRQSGQNIQLKEIYNNQNNGNLSDMNIHNNKQFLFPKI